MKTLLDVLRRRRSALAGFTLIELMLIVLLISALANIAMVSIGDSIDLAKLAAAQQTVKIIERAVAQYYSDVGFLPPDVHRGYDPGLARPLPYNYEKNVDCNVRAGDCAIGAATALQACTWCSVDWTTQVLARWHGPYLASWPQSTPWGGKYDWNPWVTPFDRNGCIVAANTYISIEGDYNNANVVPPRLEQRAIDRGLDTDRCINGEIEMLVDTAPPG
jgi:type II secretory pathway pseudopilin PulG